jgi:G3E family GTPase
VRLEGVPTLVVVGRPGAGKSTLIERLLASRPPGETWAVLVNERGATRLDPAPGVAVAEVDGGCPCCTAQVAFRVALTRLLREAHPARLFVELGAAGHLDATLKTLSGPWLASVLALGPVVEMVDLDAGAASPAGSPPADVVCVRGRGAAPAQRVVDADRATLAALYGTTVNEPR